MSSRRALGSTMALTGESQRGERGEGGGFDQWRRPTHRGQPPLALMARVLVASAIVMLILNIAARWVVVMEGMRQQSETESHVGVGRPAEQNCTAGKGTGKAAWGMRRARL